jgi:hypothetical protein
MPECHIWSQCDTCHVCLTWYIFHTCHKYYCHVSLDIKCVIAKLLVTNFNEARGEGMGGRVSKSDFKAFGGQLCSRPKAKPSVKKSNECAWHFGEPHFSSVRLLGFLWHAIDFASKWSKHPGQAGRHAIRQAGRIPQDAVIGRRDALVSNPSSSSLSWRASEASIYVLRAYSCLVYDNSLTTRDYTFSLSLSVCV